LEKYVLVRFPLPERPISKRSEAFTSVYGTRVGGANASVAKQLTEELIVPGKVSIIAGFFLAPESFAAAPVLTETKTPAVVY
jgi:hypothetical protein